MKCWAGSGLSKSLVSHTGNNWCKIFIILISVNYEQRTADCIYIARSITFTDECSSSLRRWWVQVQRFMPEKYPHFSSSQQCPFRYKSSGIWHRVDWCKQLKKFWSSLLLLSSDSILYSYKYIEPFRNWGHIWLVYIRYCPCNYITFTKDNKTRLLHNTVFNL